MSFADRPELLGTPVVLLLYFVNTLTPQSPRTRKNDQMYRYIDDLC